MGWIDLHQSAGLCIHNQKPLMKKREFLESVDCDVYNSFFPHPHRTKSGLAVQLRHSTDT